MAASSNAEIITSTLSKSELTFHSSSVNGSAPDRHGRPRKGQLSTPGGHRNSESRRYDSPLGQHYSGDIKLAVDNASGFEPAYILYDLLYGRLDFLD